MPRVWTVVGMASVYLLLGLAVRAADNFVKSADNCRDGSSDCDWCDACDSCNNPKRIVGILPSDHCFDRFISPLSNPFFFEDPRSLTEARGIFLDNSLPSSIGNGDAQVWAAQFRGRLTDRVSIIAPRLGYVQFNQVAAGAPTGFLSAPVGLKYNFIRDIDRQLLVSGGVTYFIPGSAHAFANFGGGDFHFFLTAGKEIFDWGHWLSATGFRIPTDSNFGTQLWYWSNQWDYELPGHIYPLVGVNWFHWMQSAGAGVPIPITAIDLINLPVTGVAGANVVSSVVGAKWKPSGNIEVGSGFEFPLTSRTDILHNRAYADVIFRY
jgi:hypothetical protein